MGLATDTTEAAGELAAAATEAMAHWGVEVEGVELVSMSENAVFRVDTAGGERLICRLHRPGYNTEAQMRSELTWVESLRRAGLDAPGSRRTPDGRGHVAVAVGAEQRLVGVIDWVDGVPLERAVEEDASTAAIHFHRLGSTMATIRAHAERWEPPPGFDRRRWDADGLVGPDPDWGRFWAVEALTPEQQRLFTEAREVLHRRLSALPLTPDRFGLIHADLHLNNVLADGDRLVVIDFDDAGFGWYPYELAVALQASLDEPWYGEAERALLDGYRSTHPLNDDEVALLPTFLTIRSLMLVSWLDARPELNLAHLVPVLAQAAADQAERYLANPDEGP